MNIIFYGACGYLIYSVAFFMLLGIQLNFTNVKTILRKPIGLGIGIFCNFFLVPLVSWI